MPLPILQSRGDPQPADLLRLYYRTELHWTRHLSEETPLDVGAAFANPDLPNVWAANRVLDASLSGGVSPAEAFAETEAFFRDRGTVCAQWLLNPAAAQDRTAPLADYLIAAGWRPDAADVMRLTGAPRGRVREAAGLTIIPARASFRHARELARERAAGWNEPQLAEAAMLHLDDSHYDALLALKDGEAAGCAGVLAAGDVGRIDPIYVAERFRRQGIGRTMVGRVLEVCARSLFRHVLLAVAPGDAAARQLCESFGFRKIGQIVAYQRRGVESAAGD